MLPDLQEHSSSTIEIIGDEVSGDSAHKRPYQTWSFEPPRSLLYSYWHVALDITFGLLGAAVILLTLPGMALLIYLDSPGPDLLQPGTIRISGKAISNL